MVLVAVAVLTVLQGAARGEEQTVKILAVDPKLHKMKFQVIDRETRERGVVKELKVSEQVKVSLREERGKEAEPLEGGLQADALRRTIVGGKAGARAKVEHKDGVVTSIMLLTGKRQMAKKGLPKAEKVKDVAEKVKDVAEKVKVIRIEFADGNVKSISVVYENVKTTDKNVGRKAAEEMMGRIVSVDAPHSMLKFRALDLGEAKEYKVLDTVQVVLAAGEGAEGKPVEGGLKADALRRQLLSSERGVRSAIEIQEGVVTRIKLFAPDRPKTGKGKNKEKKP
jgi:hypothetical protein